MTRLLHPAVERLDPVALRALQEERFATQWARVRAQSAFYRAKLARLPDRLDLAALQDVETTDKDELRRSQEREPPFGDYLGVPDEAVVRVHRTSGLSGRGMTLAHTRDDTAVTASTGARAMVAAGVRPSDRIVHCLNYALWTGGLTDHLILEAAGAAVVPFGVGSTRRLIDAIRDLGVTGISCTPSYPALIEQTLRAETDLEPRDLGLRIALFGGEGGLDEPGFRARLEDTFGFAVRNANFGLSEVLSILGSQCEETTDLHLHAVDAIFVELLDAAGERIAIEDGASGELVCTHLLKEAQPLLRYRTRDVLTVTGTGPCACGRTTFRFRVSGRTDDMFNVRGVNVFPNAVRAVVDRHPELASGQLRIVLRGPGPYDRVELRAEAAAGLGEERFAEAGAALADAIRRTIGASAAVELVPHGLLGRTAEKTSWIERVEA